MTCVELEDLQRPQLRTLIQDTDTVCAAGHVQTIVFARAVGRNANGKQFGPRRCTLERVIRARGKLFPAADDDDPYQVNMVWEPRIHVNPGFAESGSQRVVGGVLVAPSGTFHDLLALVSSTTDMFFGLADGRLVSAAVILAIVVAPLDSFVAAMKQYDSSFFALAIAGFLIISAIGTRIVVRSGELPANDEMFNLPELTAAQRAALRGDHVQSATTS